SFNQQNLYYEVQPKNLKSYIKVIYTFILLYHSKETGINFEGSYRSCEDTTNKLWDTYNLNMNLYFTLLANKDQLRI
ncbi:ATP-dependent DNA helicase sgs1, partial [Massospora cicadina]